MTNALVEDPQQADLTNPGARINRVKGTAAMLGPAFVAAVAYIDPGNVATNLAGGAKYGYMLVWVLVGATISAGLVQYLSAKLGLATGKSLPAVVRQGTSKSARIGYWLQAEVVAIATDLGEVVGGAIALQILFNIPLGVGGVLVGIVSMILLVFRDRRSQRGFERVITGLLLIVAVGFTAGLFVAPPDPAAAFAGLVPQFDGADSMMLAAGMLGATVMPHVVYLHSALTRDRFTKEIAEPWSKRRRILGATRADIVIAMTIAGGVNIAMLLLAASALSNSPEISTIAGAHQEIAIRVGPGVALMFAIALLVSGIASTSVGAYSGAVIMEGLLDRSIPLLVRRLITIIPAVMLLAFGVDPTMVLIASQVVLSFGIPFALIPLVRATAKKSIMGEAVNRPATTRIAWTITAAIVALNLVLIYLTFVGAG